MKENNDEKIWLYMNGAIFDAKENKKIKRLLKTDDSAVQSMHEMIDIEEALYDETEFETAQGGNEGFLRSIVLKIKEELKIIGSGMLIKVPAPAVLGENDNRSAIFKFEDSEAIKIGFNKIIPLFQKQLNKNQVLTRIKIEPPVNNMLIVVEDEILGEIAEYEYVDKPEGMELLKLKQGKYFFKFIDPSERKTLGIIELILDETSENG